MNRILCTWLVAGVLVGCQQAPEDTRTAVDTIMTNGRIATIDAGFSIESTLAISGDRFVAVGGPELLDEYIAAQTIDLGGKFVMPGFIDSHTHLHGRPLRYIDLTKTTSIEEIKGLVRDKAEELGSGEWITGYGWSEDFMAEQRRPLRVDLDEAAPDNPVILARAGGHSAVSNSLALRQAEVDETTPQPDGGVIEKGEDGRLNGVIRERQDLVSRLVPEATPAEVRDSLVGVLRDQFRFGITSFT
ncbi:MAG: amidohydrolase family protein, partial [Gammaproteobacteria bacterium]|nr:amidohydrolase family protein [Gammaproteobacteria bacterium]